MTNMTNSKKKLKMRIQQHKYEHIYARDPFNVHQNTKLLRHVFYELERGKKLNDLKLELNLVSILKLSFSTRSVRE